MRSCIAEVVGDDRQGIFIVFLEIMKVDIAAFFVAIIDSLLHVRFIATHAK